MATNYTNLDTTNPASSWTPPASPTSRDRLLDWTTRRRQMHIAPFYIITRANVDKRLLGCSHWLKGLRRHTPVIALVPFLLMPRSLFLMWKLPRSRHIDSTSEKHRQEITTTPHKKIVFNVASVAVPLESRSLCQALVSAPK